MEIGSEVFYFDSLSGIMIALVLYLGISIAFFSKNYLKGANYYKNFFLKFISLIIILITLFCANHLLIFLLTSLGSNLLLIQLMAPNVQWRAARNSARLASKNFLIGFVCLSLGVFILYYLGGTYSVQVLMEKKYGSDNLLLFGLLLITVGAMAQSSLWPFNKWLLSSLNSPTPVSAFMHAGLINGGGFVIIRFSPLFVSTPFLLNLLFVLGLVSTLIGSCLGFVQNDIKRSLALSTMAQIGFMIVQCGLGLFSSALIHLFCHGVFKSYLFLTTGSILEERNVGFKNVLTPLNLLLALFCGISMGLSFAYAMKMDLILLDTNFFLFCIIVITGTQVSLSFISNCSIKRYPLVLILSSLMGYLYGLSKCWLEGTFYLFEASTRIPLNRLHIIGLVVIFIFWGSFLFLKHMFSRQEPPRWMFKYYVKLLNWGQPHPETITTSHNQYC